MIVHFGMSTRARNAEKNSIGSILPHPLHSHHIRNHLTVNAICREHIPQGIEVNFKQCYFTHGNCEYAWKCEVFLFLVSFGSNSTSFSVKICCCLFHFSLSRRSEISLEVFDFLVRQAKNNVWFWTIWSKKKQQQQQQHTIKILKWRVFERFRETIALLLLLFIGTIWSGIQNNDNDCNHNELGTCLCRCLYREKDAREILTLYYCSHNIPYQCLLSIQYVKQPDWCMLAFSLCDMRNIYINTIHEWIEFVGLLQSIAPTITQWNLTWCLIVVVSCRTRSTRQLVNERFRLKHFKHFLNFDVSHLGHSMDFDFTLDVIQLKMTYSQIVYCNVYEWE